MAAPQHDRVVFTPRREFRAIRVVEKATGKIISIKDYRFNPVFHDYLDVPEDAEVVVPVASYASAVTTSTSAATATVVVPSDHPDVGYNETEDAEKPWFHRPTGKRFKTLAVLKRFIKHGF